jgi:hypothetical protein
LQPGGHRFEPGILHQSLPAVMFASASSSWQGQRLAAVRQ